MPFCEAKLGIPKRCLIASSPSLLRFCGLCSLCMCAKTTSKIQCVIIKKYLWGLLVSSLQYSALTATYFQNPGLWLCGRAFDSGKKNRKFESVWKQWVQFTFVAFSGTNVLYAKFLSCNSSSKPAARWGIPPRLIFNLVPRLEPWSFTGVLLQFLVLFSKFWSYNLPENSVARGGRKKSYPS